MKRPPEISWDDPIVVAEVGINHQGNISVAKDLIRAAALAGAKIVKFQKRDVEALSDEVKARPRTDSHAFGATEIEHRRALEFSWEQHHDLKTYAESIGIQYGCSAWDMGSYAGCLKLGLTYVKIPSAKNIEVLDWGVSQTVPIHISLGMTTGDERGRILDWIDDRHNVGDAVYVCTSTYPCENSDVFLLDILGLRARGLSVVGFSGHHRGIQLDVAAYTLGAQWFERHLTLDRSSKGTDQAASLEPDAFRKLVRDLKATRSALKSRPKHIPDCEIQMRKKFKGD